jgi:spermidine synthase
VLEALGSVAGGAGVTLALVAGVEPTSVALAALALVLLPLGLSGVTALRGGGPAWRSLARAVPVTLVLALVLGGGGTWLSRELAERRLAVLLPDAELITVAHSAQGEIIRGRRPGQELLLLDGQVAFSWPDREGSARLAALLLAQHPAGGDLLLHGEAAPGVALELLRYQPLVRSVSVAHPDPVFLREAWRVVGVDPVATPGLRSLGGNLREHLARASSSHDVIAVLDGDPATFSANRTRTLEFVELAARALRPGGVLAARFSGAESFLGNELAGYGVSVLRTLRQVFHYLALQPGSDSLLFASAEPGLSEDPSVLSARLRALPQLPGAFPPAAVAGLFLPDRIRQAREVYEKTAPLPEARLVNRDGQPSSHLFSLLLAGRHEGAALFDLVRGLAFGGRGLAWLPGLVLLAAAVAFAALQRRQGVRRRAAGAAVTALAGFLGMAGWLVLLDLYQVRFGTAYLHVGLLSAAFMGGLAAGGAVGARLYRVDRAPGLPRRLLPALALLVTLALLGAAWPGMGRVALGAALALLGLEAGLAFPLGAALAGAGLEPEERASRAGTFVEAWDHAGAALGGAVACLWWLPVLGVGMALEGLLVLAGLMLALSLWDRWPGWQAGEGQLPRGRALAWGLGVGLVALGLGRGVSLRAVAEAQPSLPPGAVSGLAAGATWVEHPGPPAYVELKDAQGSTTGYVLSSRELAPGALGYGGPLNVLVRVTPDGTVRAVTLAGDRETPAYRAAVERNLGRWVERNPTKPEGFAGVEAVSGATVTSNAVQRALEESVRRFSVEVLGRHDLPGAQPTPAASPWPTLALVLSLACSVALAFRPHRWLRRAFLAGNAGLLGVLWNVQASSEQVVGWLEVRLPAAGPSFPFLLSAGVFAVVLLLGNLYCGHACPAGGLQELLSELSPWRVRPSPGWRDRARWGRYAVLAALLAGYFLTGDRGLLAVDPLTGAFALQLDAGAALLAGLALAAGLFVPRFFCRFLCPTGAALSLLAAWRPALPWGPGGSRGGGSNPPWPGGRRGDRVPARTGARLFPAIWLLLLGLFLALIAGHALHSHEGLPIAGGARQPRVVDVGKVQEQIRAGQLSDHKAQFYQVAP